MYIGQVFPKVFKKKIDIFSYSEFQKSTYL